MLWARPIRGLLVHRSLSRTIISCLLHDIIFNWSMHGQGRVWFLLCCLRSYMGCSPCLMQVSPSKALSHGRFLRGFYSVSFKYLQVVIGLDVLWGGEDTRFQYWESLEMSVPISLFLDMFVSILVWSNVEKGSKWVISSTHFLLKIWGWDLPWPHVEGGVTLTVGASLVSKLVV